MAYAIRIKKLIAKGEEILLLPSSVSNSPTEQKQSEKVVESMPKDNIPAIPSTTTVEEPLHIKIQESNPVNTAAGPQNIIPTMMTD